MSWMELDFGKHEGKTLPQVLFSDPDWFFWAVETGVFKKRMYLKSEVEKIFNRATRIKIPQTGEKTLVVEYWIHHPTKKFSHFDLVPIDRSPHVGSSTTFRSDYIDMSVPRRIARYDKTGCKALIRSLKSHILGGPKVRLTRQLCESFFDEDDNFV